MPTDISVTSTTSRRAPGRLWLGSPHGTDAPIHVTFDFATFTHANFTATGQIQNGCLLGKITASGKYGPYDDAATDGRQTLSGFLFTAVNEVGQHNSLFDIERADPLWPVDLMAA